MAIRNIEDIYELSPVQQGIFFHSFTAAEPDMYCIQLKLRLRGRVERAAFRRAWERALDRHPILRTSFHLNEVDKPLQVVHRDVALALPEHDLRHLPAPEQQAQLENYLTADRANRFDFDAPPLMRLALFRTSDDASELVWSHHHLILDGWSMSVLLKEVFESYKSLAQGREPELAASRSYGDYIAWLQQQDLSRAETFWRESLKGFAAPTLLRVERSQPATDSAPHVFTRLERRLSGDVTAELQAFARSSQLTLNTLVQGAWALLLSRYSGERDVVFGTVVSDRALTLRDAESIVGPLINTLPMRAVVDDGATVAGWLRELQARQARMRRYSSSPLAKVQGWSDVPSGLPLFETAFAFENYPVDESLRGRDEALEITGVEHVAKSNYALAVVALLDPELVIRVTYDNRRFETNTVERMLGHLETLLRSMPAGGEQQRLSSLSLLTPEEREQLVVEWNRTEFEFTQGKCVHELFEEQVARTPSAVALVHEGRKLTYQELNGRANQLARYLRRLGVEPDVLVGICVERSLEMVVGLLGVLKAGGAYLPLDPNYPAQRLSFMQQDAGLAIVLTQEHLTDALPDHWGQMVFMDSDWDAIARESEENLVNLTVPDNLINVIYTSGSTGKPKAAMLTHRSLRNTIGAQQQVFRLDAESRVTQFASFSFDASFFEMMLALQVGATLYLTTHETSLPGAPMLKLLRDEEISMAFFPPSVLAVLPEEEELPALRTILAAGEACPLDLIKRWADGRRFFNAWGPTEVSIWNSVSQCFADDERVTIGRPIANTKIYALDENLELVPIGVPGELHVGGTCLGRGYLHRPDLTAEKFVPNPFDNQPGSRLYKTGDLARFLDDGQIEFVGRIDHQVKIRGFRVETGEIEAVLGAHMAVRETVVIAREDTPGDKRLVAYLVLADGASLNVGELRAHLLERLPDYMVPAAFVTLEAWPLSPNGKLDRRALPSPERARLNTEKEIVLPRTELEKFLADSWREVLHVDEVAIDDDFFHSGGDSIKAIILTNKLQERLGEVVHVVAVFDATTIRELVDYLYEHNSESVSKLFGARDGDTSSPARVEPVDASKVERMRESIKLLSPRTEATPVAKNPPAIFVLSAPRSGSTLFRVMLGGSPALFAPPELELLSFNTLRQRKETFNGRDHFWLEGTIRAVMEIKGCDADEATRIIEDGERRDLGTREFYGLLQQWLGERRLVDKTPSYALDPEVLNRAETLFEGALYIHLLRHPVAMIRSFREARIDQILSRYKHSFSARELGELVWTISHQNILTFLERVPSERQHRVKFEDLVGDPRRALEGLCRFLDIDLHPAMLQPYEDKQRRMTDGIHAMSKMLGDVKFHEHKKIDAKVAESWKASDEVGALGDVTWEVAEKFGYVRPDASAEERSQVDGVVITSLEHVERDEATELPLSFAQQRLWFLDQLEPGGLSYNCAGAARLTGELDARALQQSLNEIVRRHESLRTTFPSANGSPRQVVVPALDVPLPLVDLSRMARSEREAELERMIREESERPFDLARSPLVRTVLVKLDDDEHALLLSMHHIVSDGWSIGIFMREMAALYAAFAACLPSPLAPLPVQYADFARWQRQWLSGERLDRQLDFWRLHLTGAPAALELPTDHPRDGDLRYRGARLRLTLGQAVLDGFQDVARQAGATLFMALMAAFRVLLSRLSGQAEVVVGTPVAARTRAEVEGLIGFFVNTLALRGRVERGESFRELLVREREICLGGFEHQEVPFERVVEELQPERSLLHAPVFQVFFNLLNARDNDLELPGLTVETLGDEIPASKFDITMYAREQREQLHLEMVYNADLFDEPRIAEMMSQFALLLEQVVRRPEQSLDAFSLVTPRAETVLPQPSQPLPATRDDEAAHIFFARQAAAHPRRIALTDGSGEWTYAALEARSNQLANHLRANGIERGNVVAIYAHRSAAFVCALLGVLKAGAAFTILDPAYPASRLVECLEIAKPRGIVQLEAAGELPAAVREFFDASTHGCRVVLPPQSEAIEELLQGRSTDAPANVTTEPDTLAYIAFTSGSTGKPKGILGTHAPLSHFLRWHCETFGLREADRFSMLSGLAHDPLLRDIFTPLRLGATLCIPKQEDLAAPGKLFEWMRREAVTVTHLTPVMMRLIAGTIGKTVAASANGSGNGNHNGHNDRNGDRNGDGLPSLRYAFFGGDALAMREVSALKRLAGSVACVNFYGTTETPQAMAYHVVERDVDEAGREAARGESRAVPVGRGISDAQLLILNAANELAGVGELGEICVRTRYLSKGYVDDESLTRSRYVINPATGHDDDRFYRTGDLGRYTPDGLVVFAGRADWQVKIRGFRVELGEVEAALNACEAVQSAAVVADDDATGDKRLVAYVVARPGTPPTVHELRGRLGETLPHYMIPSLIVLLDAMPLSPNGKIDRAGLPTPDWSMSAPGEIFVAPRTPVETEMAEIWSAVLGLSRVGIHDNFFALGGHSLLATQVVSRIREAFQVELPLRTLFREPTVAGLSLAVTQMQVESEDEEELAQMIDELKQLSGDALRSVYNDER